MDGPILPENPENEDEAERLALLRPNNDYVWDIPRAPDPGRALSADIDLFCPHCDYNVRGLAENRCPECGNEFNPDRLIRWSTEPDLPLSFMRSENAEHEGFVLVGSLIRPSRLGREIPPLARGGSAAAYGWGMRGLGALAMLFVAGALAGGEAMGWTLLLSVIPILATLFCETMVALLLKRLVEPLAVPADQRYRFWRTICYCFSTYFPISCAAVPLLAWMILQVIEPLFMGRPASRPGFEILMGLLMLIGPALMILWWWLALRVAIVARGRPSTGRTATICLIPLVGLVSVIVGLALDWLAVVFLLFVVGAR